MAEKRMFSKTVIDSDVFIDMPISARLLYYDLGMRADDDGFVNAPKKIARMIGAAADDLRILAQRGFIIPFDSGVVVIRHWKVNNLIKNDRYHETAYKAEKQLLTIEKSAPYELKNGDGTGMDTEWNHDGSILEPQVRLGKDRIDNNIINNIVCTEPLASSMPAIELNDGSEWFPKVSDVEEWSKLYPGIDVKTELGRMRQWCKSNPSKRKTKRGVRRFVQTWLDREQNRAKGKAGSGDKNKFNQFEQNHYDFEQLEKELVFNQEGGQV